MEAVLRPNHRGLLAMETIDFQDNTTGMAMEDIVGRLQANIVNGTYSTNDDVEKAPEVKELEKYLFTRFGLKFHVIVDSMLAAVLPFYANKHHIFIDEFFRGHVNISTQNKILRDADNKKGYVDTKNATVGGLFSEYENSLFLNFISLFRNYKMSVPEVVAVTLHEIGHAFYSCEYSDRLETNNQVLASVSKEIFSKKPNKDLTYVFRELKTLNDKTTESEVDDLVNGNRIIASYRWFRIVAGTVEEQLKNKKYSETSFEQMADNFAGRFNYGRALVSGLQKIHSVDKSPEFSKASKFFWRFAETAFVTIAMLSPFFGVIPVAVILYMNLALVLRFSGEDKLDYTYDELKIRYKRIRNEYVQMLKDSKIKSAQAKEIIDSITIIDKMMDSALSFKPILNSVANFIFTPAREAKAKIVEQQLLEDLAMNDLFVKSAEIKTLVD